MDRFQGKVRFLAGLLLAGMVMVVTETGFPAKAQSDDWTHLEIDRVPTRAIEKPDVTWLMAAHYDARPEGMPIDMIVIHDTETPGVRDARTIWRHFANPKSMVSAHYIIGKDGEIVQSVPDELRAWHTGESYYQGEDHLNDRSIGIELVNAQTGVDPFTNAQYKSLVRLVSYLVNVHDIPMDRIVGHKDITLKPEHKKDPAANFSWSRFMGGVRTTLAVASVRQADSRR